MPFRVPYRNVSHLHRMRGKVQVCRGYFWPERSRWAESVQMSFEESWNLNQEFKDSLTTDKKRVLNRYSPIENLEVDNTFPPIALRIVSVIS